MVNIRLYDETADNIDLVNRNLVDIFDYTKLIDPPKNFSLLRNVLKDFNKILQEEVHNDSTNETKILTVSTSSNSERDLPDKDYKGAYLVNIMICAFTVVING